MTRFLRDILTPTSAGEYGRAEWTLHWLLAAAIALPLLIFAAAATISYWQNQVDAQDRLQRNLGTVSFIGPMRMDYARAIITVREAAQQLSRFVEDIYEAS